jgi:cytochrome P450
MRKVYDYGHDDPYRLEPAPLYAKLRSEEPVARVRPPYGEDAWLVTRYESVKTVLHDPAFSRTAAVNHPEGIPRVTPRATRVNLLSASDPPDHGRLRQLIVGAFTQRRSAQYRPRSEEIANELLEDLIAAGPPADLVAGFAKPYPILSFSEILGIPREECQQAKEWTEPLLSADSTAAEVAAAHARVDEYLTGLLDRRRQQPEDDLLTTLVQLQASTNDYTNDEILALVSSLLVNGTMPSQIANCVYTLLVHPDQLAWLRDNLDQLPQAVEELLRFAPLGPNAPNAAQGHIRYAVKDIDIDGVTIHAGEWVIPAIASANRDEEIFDNPDEFDLTRTPNPHIAFGFGTHHCPGAPFSRMQLQVAISAVLSHFPRLALAVPEDDIPWRTKHATRAPQVLPVTW